MSWNPIEIQWIGINPARISGHADSAQRILAYARFLRPTFAIP